MARAAAVHSIAKARPTTAQSQSKQQFGFQANWNLTSNRPEFFPDKTGIWLLRDLERMAERDETAGAMLWCITSTLSQITWTHTPMVSGKEAKNDPEATRQAAFADTLLVDMQDSFSDHIEESITTLLWAGFSATEFVTKQRTADNSEFPDLLYGVDKLIGIDPLAVNQWLYADRTARDVIGLRQISVLGSANVPLWKCLHYRLRSSVARPQGRPLFKGVHRAWQLKTRIQDSEAIGIERDLCGLPIFKIPESEINLAAETDSAGAPTEEALGAQARIASAQKAVSDMRFNMSGGLVIPSDTFADDNPTDKTPKYDLSILTTAGQKSIDPRNAIRDYDRAIARVALMQFLHLGDRSSGSFGLSDDQSSMALRSLKALAKKVTDEWRSKVLSRIWLVNQFDPKYLPSLSSDDINKDGIAQLGAYMSGLGKSETLWGPDAVARQALFDAANIQYDPTAQQTAAQKYATQPVAKPAAPGGSDANS